MKKQNEQKAINKRCCATPNPVTVKTTILAPIQAFGLIVALGLGSLLVYSFWPKKLPNQDIKVLSAVFDCKEVGSKSRLHVYGDLQNTDDDNFSDIYFNSSFYDVDGKLIDSDSENQEKLSVPANANVTFSIFHEGEKSCSSYETIKVQVIDSNKIAKTEEKKKSA